MYRSITACDLVIHSHSPVVRPRCCADSSASVRAASRSAGDSSPSPVCR